MRIAILDLGTNTFNLLVSEASLENRLSVIHTSKEPVKLGKGGIHKGIITDEAMQRGLHAIEAHLDTLKKFRPEKVYAFGTSAIRDARNGKDFINMVSERFDIFVHIIPGDREADFIYKGVRQSFEMDDNPVMILDIGGGSNEFIIADKKQIYWKNSFNLGMARMLELFPLSDPVTASEITELEGFFEQELKPLFPAVKKFIPATLIGASGSFETFYALLCNLFPEKYPVKNDFPSRDLDLEDYYLIHNKLIHSSSEERALMKGMEPVRIDMIIPATILVNYILSVCNIERLVQSDFALKEGVIAEMLNL